MKTGDIISFYDDGKIIKGKFIGIHKTFIFKKYIVLLKNGQHKLVSPRNVRR